MYIKLLFISRRLLTFVSALFFCFSNTAHAWIYSEHRDIALLAVENLDTEYRAKFDELWNDSRIGFEKKLCENAADTAQGQQTNCLDWAAYSAIAGDHSCSSQEMLGSILNEPWLLDVANISAHLKSVLATVPTHDASDGGLSLANISDHIDKQENRAKRLNALRSADLQLLRVDPLYATRAGSNTAHFLIARPTTKTTNMEYARLALREGSEINAVGVYAWYHRNALQKASRLANEPQLSPEQRQIIIRSMLADEGFALHFLEDMFAAGHVAGTWGEVSQRLGTHDYYNQHGLEVYTWNRERFPTVIMGDAHMRPQDTKLAASTISASLKQVLDFSMGKDTGYIQPYTPTASAEPENFNVCTNNQFPAHNFGHDYDYDIALIEILFNTPMPSLDLGPGSLPRFRSEVGSFIGLAGTIDARVIDGGFFDSQDEAGGIIGLDLSFRAGFGMDGVMDELGDGLVFASIGFRSDSASSNRFADASLLDQGGSLAAAIPARSGFTVRFRMPFYVIPTDLFWLSPLYLFNETAYTNMAVTAANGGLIPWQSGMATSVGRFQFVLGREIGATFFGRTNTDNIIVPPTSTSSPGITSIESILFDFPILEYRPYRSFSSNQSSSVMFQLFTSADVPQSIKLDNNNDQSLKTIWAIGIRLVFDWRHY